MYRADMLRVWLLVLPLVLSVAAIKVPIEPEDKQSEAETPSSEEDSQQSSSQSDNTPTDSYQVQREEQPDTFYKDDDQHGIVAPARHLLPPRLDAAVLSYPSDPQTEEGDWKPMLKDLPKVSHGPTFVNFQESPNTNFEEGEQITLLNDQGLPAESIRQWFNPKLSAVQESAISELKQEKYSENSHLSSLPIIIPSAHLQPPLPDSVPSDNFDMVVPSANLRPPLFKPQTIFRPTVQKLKPIMPTISLEMQPPTLPQPKNYKNPTNLYPKKYSHGHAYKPIPIPMRQFSDGNVQEIPKARPVKYFKPELYQNEHEDNSDSVENEKKVLKYQQAEEKRKFQDEENAQKQQEFVDSTVAEAFATQPAEGSPEQETSETGFYANGQDSYAAAPAPAPASGDAPAPAERTEFRMHGLQGPNSYKFGYDTGKGKNRQFRYEERNNDGYVRGHYGYVDRHGKTQVVNYDAHPEHGFHAEGPFGKT